MPQLFIFSLCLCLNYSSFPFVYAFQLPEVLHSSLLKTKPVIATFLSLLGMLVGFAIMFCLAAWEEELEGSL